ncbi:HAD family hydrolase [Actinomadura gamaensis]|uniref:HAD family hydrolase n=1 Tax=Actinomadura gamaensis TaxID=1763541 RepID=A0ABV9TSL6_9ACTN
MSDALNVRAVLFDLYRTLIDIWTNERHERVWRGLAGFLSYQDVRISPGDLSAGFFAGLARQLRESREPYGEVDVTLAFQDILTEAGHADPSGLAAATAGAFRTLSIVRFELFPDVLPALGRLRPRFELAVISDAQRAFFRPELAATGLAPLFRVAIASGEHGFHKPDPRLFAMALRRLGVPPEQAVYVGDSPDRDMRGARAAGVRPVLLDRGGDLGAGLPDCPPDRIVRSLDALCDWLIPPGAGTGAGAGGRG